jgi:hypothetical protein
VRRVAKGEHTIRVECGGNVRVDKLVVKSIPELVQCGLNSSSIKSYGPFDMEFLKKDVLPNVTTLIVSPGIKLPQSVIDDWHRQAWALQRRPTPVRRPNRATPKRPQSRSGF